MNATRFFVGVFVLILLLTLGGAASAQEPEPLDTTGCPSGNDHDPLCDVTHDGEDVQRVASRHRSQGAYSEAYWSLSGNAGTTPGTDFLGTTDGTDLIINPNGGNVGIGVSNPSEALEVAGGFIKSGTVAVGRDSVGSPRGNGNYTNFGSNHHGTTLVANNLYIDDSDAMKISNTHSTMAGAAIKIPGNGRPRQNYIEFWTTPTGSVTADAAYAESSPRMVIDPSGNVGIGTTSPSDKFHVRLQNDSTERVLIERADANRSAVLRLLNGGPIIQMDDSANGAYIRANLWTDLGDAGSLQFGRVLSPQQPDPTFQPYVHITGSGNVGIGTTTPQQKLDVRSEDNTVARFGGTTGFGGIQVGHDGGGIMFLGFGAAHSSIWFEEATDTIHITGDTTLFGDNDYGETNVAVDGKIGIGTTTPQARLDVAGRTRTHVLEITGGSDLAEPFEIVGAENVEPGMVVAIDPEHPGQLRIAGKAYDRTVAGCVSGAGGVKPGLTMQHEGTVAEGSSPVALSGRVYCWADASYGPIQPGDLLTTSDTPGHAMRVADYSKAQGAIIGKAMTGLEAGQGFTLVLVSLQ